VAKKKKKHTYPKQYDSKLEYDLHEKELKHLEHHPQPFAYTVQHTYEPDFYFETEDYRCLVEVKGRFRERKEATKYLYIREALNQEDKETELIFLFSDANKPFPHAQKRADGTKQTHGEWARKNQFRYFCLKKDKLPTWLTRCKQPKQKPSSHSLLKGKQ